MRKFGIKYAASHPEYHSVRADFVRVRSCADWESILEKWYSGNEPGVFPPAELHQVGEEGCGTD
jgi:hypothetical protein